MTVKACNQRIESDKISATQNIPWNFDGPKNIVSVLSTLISNVTLYGESWTMAVIPSDNQKISLAKISRGKKKYKQIFVFSLKARFMTKSEVGGYLLGTQHAPVTAKVSWGRFRERTKVTSKQISLLFLNLLSY